MVDIVRDRLLVVDDDPTIRALMALGLARRFEVDTAANAEEAANLFSPGRYRALVVDLNLPGLSGDELVTRLRKKEPYLRAILLTGELMVDEDARLRPFDAWITKPIRSVEAFVDTMLAVGA